MQIVTAKQMYVADAQAIDGGTTGQLLMEKAGSRVVDAIEDRYSYCPVLVICGPGNNGGDGFVIARLLEEKGWDVTIALSFNETELKGDAKHAADKCKSKMLPLSISLLKDAELIVDAVFGIGLKRQLDADLVEFIKEVTKHNMQVVAVDMPTGVCSDTGEILGEAFYADLTVTFGCKKIGHVLLPGKECCGELVVVDIGITLSPQEEVINENLTDLWLDSFPFHQNKQHKYNRGHAIVAGGDIDSTGATKLAALSALRIGAGLVTVASPSNALTIYAESLTSVMAKPYNTIDEFKNLIKDDRKNAILLGPGNGIQERTKQQVFAVLDFEKHCVIDADAITVFWDDPTQLFSKIKSPTVITPHEGEFRRLFNFNGQRIDLVKEAAKESNAVIVLKGNDTVIAAPDGRVAINTNAPSTLATAGSGDVLAGLIVGLLANEMDAFEASCAAVWIHSEAANITGIGMISEDLPQLIPRVLEQLLFERY